MRKTSNRTDTATVWIGLVEVRPRRGNTTLGRAIGAFSNLLVWATDVDEFRATASAALNEYDFDVVRMTEVETFRSRVNRVGVIPELEQLAEQVTAENRVQFDEFQSYRSRG